MKETKSMNNKKYFTILVQKCLKSQVSQRDFDFQDYTLHDHHPVERRPSPHQRMQQSEEEEDIMLENNFSSVPNFIFISLPLS